MYFQGMSKFIILRMRKILIRLINIYCIKHINYLTLAFKIIKRWYYQGWVRVIRGGEYGLIRWVDLFSEELSNFNDESQVEIYLWKTL